MNRLDWLDNLAFRQIEKIHNNSPASKNGEHFLLIDFPRFDFPIVYSDHEYPVAHSHYASSTPSDSTQLPSQQPGRAITVDGTTGARNPGQPVPRVICKVYDPEVGRDNPCEAMHRRLMRSQRNGPVDRDLKPNSKIRDELNQIMEYSPTHELSPEEKDLVWKFRFYLTRDKRALTKFVKSVSWSDAAEIKQAVSLVYKWTEVDIDDALELLGPEIRNPDIRAYAVERLGSADDEELQLYLLQLVQALKFERTMTSASSDSPIPLSRLAEFLISRAASNPQLGSYFYWYLLVEIEDPDSERKRLYSKVNYEFQLAMRRLPNGDATRAIMKRQGEFIFLLGQISTELEKVRDRTKKEERLKEILSDPKSGLLSFDPIPLPLDPTVTITGCFPEKSIIFKSSLSPMLLYLKTSSGDEYPVIFKSGDDLRQDQLVIQIIILMDRLLRHENLDLKLTPYHILATSAFTGLVQFVKSMSLAAIEDPRKNPSGKSGIQAFLRHYHPDPSAPFGIKPSIIDTYIKSCAGYCVITYILGVGDRHLDNLLLSPDGHFFHADFGYILGRDPKPFAPPLKLCSEMVDGMGGPESVGYKQFKQYCFTTFVGLRKNARLVLNLFALMRDANVPDIRLEPDKAVGKVRAKFELGDEEGGGQKVSEEEAVRRFEEVLERSLSSLVPVLLERVHKVAMKWRT